MPLFIIERHFSEKLDLTDDDVRAIENINDDVGVRWIYSFLSADKKKTYCLYEATTAELIRDAARRANVPADAVIEVFSARRAPDGSPTSRLRFGWRSPS